MYCPKCGLQMPESARFCPQCGTDVEPPAPAPEYAQAPEQPVVGYQPSMAGGPGLDRPADLPKGSTYLVWSILVTLFCCLPLGIPAIIFATKIDTAAAQGDLEGAREYAKKAKTLMIIGAVGSVVVSILSMVFTMMMGYSI